MAKAPAFQFYVKDFLADVELQAASASSRGIWINALCLMWESRTRGEISGHETIMPRRLNCTPEEFALFLSENKSLKFANVTICNGEVTIRNRRMFNEEKSREDNRLRVRKCRRNAASNENVTPPSSSASAKKEKEESSLRSDSCAEVKKSPPAPEPVPPASLPVKRPASPPDTSKVLGTLPLANGTDFEVRQALVDKLSPLYPAVDVLAAFRSMKSWLIGHPKKLKTKRGIMAFITGWLDRDQNQGGNVPAARASPSFPLTPRQQQTERFKGMAIALKNREASGNGGNHTGGCSGDADAVFPVLPGPGCERGNHGDSH